MLPIHAILSALTAQLETDNTVILQADPGAGGTLDLSEAAGLALPDGSSYITPTNGTKPVVPGPPAVIDGVVQGEE